MLSDVIVSACYRISLAYFKLFVSIDLLANLHNNSV